MRLHFFQLLFMLNCCFFLPACVAVKTDINFMQPDTYLYEKNHDSGYGSTLRIYCYQGLRKVFSRLLESVELHLDINGTDFQQYEGANASEVYAHYQDQQSLFSFTLFSQKRKRLHLNPFAQTCIGIDTALPYRVHLVQLRVDLWRLLQLALALLMFANARRLSDNRLFYYMTGVVLGICCSFMLLVWLTSKLLPRRSMMYGTIIGGWAVGLYIARMLWENLQTLVLTYRNFIIWYILGTGLVSFFFCYRWGPPKNYRSKQIIKWVLQLMALGLIYNACSFEEAAVAVMIASLILLYFPLRSLNRLYRRRFPPKRRLLTNEEFYEQAVVETRKALDELREYARSPECPHWRVMQRLSNPVRFAQFAEGASHVSDDEVLNHESCLGDEDEYDDYEAEGQSDYSDRSQTDNHYLRTSYKYGSSSFRFGSSH